MGAVTTIIGLDDFTERFCYVYSDARGVSRVYEMSFDDGNTIVARWEKSRDGSSWELDFELTYTKAG